MAAPDDTALPPRRLSDPRELTALAHPVRMGIVELLSVSGPMTATELADALDESPANCSWHLRKLAEHRFVEEAEGGRGRRRPWRVSGVGFSWNDADAGPEELRAGRTLERMMLERMLDRYHAARERLLGDEPAWQQSAGFSESATWLTAEELAEVNTALTGVLQRHHDRLQDPTARPPGSRLCEFVAWGAPVAIAERPPRPGVPSAAEPAP